MKQFNYKMKHYKKLKTASKLMLAYFIIMIILGGM
jgi:hypothetical protein